MLSTLYALPEPAKLTVIAGGTLAFIYGLVISGRALRLRPGPTGDILRLIDLVRGLRAWLCGLCLVGLGAAAVVELRWLVIASVVIGLEELYETSMALACLETIEEKERAAVVEAAAPGGYNLAPSP